MCHSFSVSCSLCVSAGSSPPPSLSLCCSSSGFCYILSRSSSKLCSSWSGHSAVTCSMIALPKDGGEYAYTYNRDTRTRRTIIQITIVRIYIYSLQVQDALQHNGMTNSETEIEKLTTPRVRSTGSDFCRNYQSTKEKNMRKLTRTCKIDSLHDTVFHKLSIINPIIDYMHQLSFLHFKTM